MVLLVMLCSFCKHKYKMSTKLWQVSTQKKTVQVNIRFVLCFWFSGLVFVVDFVFSHRSFISRTVEWCQALQIDFVWMASNELIAKSKLFSSVLMHLNINLTIIFSIWCNQKHFSHSIFYFTLGQCSLWQTSEMKLPCLNS